MIDLDEFDLVDQLDEDLPDPLAFTPVPLQRARRNGWTPQRQADFIRALAALGNASRAAKAVGMTKQSAYHLAARPGAESFVRAWDMAALMGYETQLSAVIDRALNGVTTPRYYKGKLVGTRHRFDHASAIAAIDSRPPPRMRNKVARSRPPL